ncbi:MAG: quinone oxidoreductase [Verrucomicrobia bacterium]|nr:quinone oxidoreductase [Verrucomicrobiota bacterium]
MKAIRVHQLGGPEALVLEDIPTPTPSRGEALVKVAAAGVNFLDVYQRTGRYPLLLPFTLGMEGAGTVESLGPDTQIAGIAPGARVAWAMHLGSFAEYAVVPATKLVPVPAGIDDRSAAAAMLQGMTAHYLCETTYPVKSGETALIHAGAGGTGLLLIQMCKRRGARVLTTVSTPEKAELARGAGADEVILYTQTDFSAEARRLTDGKGVHVVYDSVGKTTFDGSLACLRPRGYLVLFGAASGAVPPVDPMVLAQKGSLFLTRPSLANYAAERGELLQRAGDVLGWIANGELKLRMEHVYPLADVAQAHRDLESRQTTGKLVLVI